MSYPPPPNPYGYYAAPAPAYPYAHAPGLKYAGGGGTAITAAVLSFLGVIAHGALPAFGLVMLVALLDNDYGGSGSYGTDWFYPWAIGSGILQMAMALLLLIGGIQLLRHRSSGRAMIALACVVVIVIGVVAIVVTAAQTSQLNSMVDDIGVDSAFTDINNAAMGFGVVSGLVMLIFPVLTLVLVLVPATKRWCEPIAPPPYATY